MLYVFEQEIQDPEGLYNNGITILFNIVDALAGIVSCYLTVNLQILHVPFIYLITETAVSIMFLLFDVIMF